MVKSQELAEAWKKLIVGQDHAIDSIIPYIVRAMAGLNVPNRPVGVFFLMGPTGTGKTRTAETLSEVLHGTEKNVLRIDCGEFQMEHEVAKLIGAPPGYLGHRETHPVLSQAKINAGASDKSPFSIILFDEIEKASASMWRILLGVLDKATLRLGDNTSSDFQKTIIFMSSNLGAKEMSEIFTGGFGFTRLADTPLSVDTFTESHFNIIKKIGLGALARKFPPEFPNRVDEIITYKPLNADCLRKITLLELGKIQTQITDRLGNKAFTINYDESALSFITRKGTSVQYGARELKRIVNRHLMNPLADDYIGGKILPGADVFCKVENDVMEWEIENPSPFDEIEPMLEYKEFSQEEEPAPTIKRTRKKRDN
jgi:ATP-dependent Clp protease ATP-binding subunit ClpA